MTTLEQMTEAARVKLTRARIAMLTQHPFYGRLVMQLSLVPRVQKYAMSTDGERLFYNPQTIVEWTNDRVLAAFAHEVQHCANGHPWRQGARDNEKWNVACDHVINLRLKEDGFDIGDNWLADPRFKGLSAEVVYARLPDDAGGGGSGSDDDGDSGDRPGEVEKPQPAADGTESAHEAEERLDAEWRIAVQQAANAAAAEAGVDAGAAAEALAEARRARVDWRAETRRKCAEITRDDYSWTLPSARYIARGLYMPQLRDERMGTMVVVRDTSGSITGAEVEQFNGEIQSIAADVQPRRLIVIDCDARMQKVWDVEAGDALPDLSQVHGRGGTSFVPPFEWLEREAIDAKLVVYLTDLYGTFPKAAPPCDVLWVTTSREVAPFGETLPLYG